MTSKQVNSPHQLVDDLLMSHGLRKTVLSRLVLGFFEANPHTAYTHAQLQEKLSAIHAFEIDKVTLYRLIDRLTQVSLLLCRVDVHRVRSYQKMPEAVVNMPFFHCQSCQKDSSITQVIQKEAIDLTRAAENASQHLASLGYQNISYQVSLDGICTDCVQRGLQ
jgi:Fur family ferric uptake transcriptional regulator